MEINIISTRAGQSPWSIWLVTLHWKTLSHSGCPQDQPGHSFSQVPPTTTSHPQTDRRTKPTSSVVRSALSVASEPTRLRREVAACPSGHHALCTVSLGSWSLPPLSTGASLGLFRVSSERHHLLAQSYLNNFTSIELNFLISKMQMLVLSVLVRIKCKHLWISQFSQQST